MPVQTFYRHGGKGGVAPMKNSHARAIRGDVGGWSASATRRNTEFLYSIREDELTGEGYAVTLTLRDCPQDSDAWHKLRRAWTMRMQRAGMVRLHWVTEWQRRGVPHLHVAIWFAEAVSLQTVRNRALGAWIDIAASYGAAMRGQDVHPITGAVGWFQYVSKHAARGVKHYQRSIENVPEPWKLKTGRMWGKWGEWPVQPPLRVNLEGAEGDRGYYAFRRMVRSWRVADARADGNVRRIHLAKSMLACPDRARSSVRGFSEWMPQHVTLALLANVASRGYGIRYGADEVPDVSNPEAERDADNRWLAENVGCGA